MNRLKPWEQAKKLVNGLMIILALSLLLSVFLPNVLLTDARPVYASTTASTPTTPTPSAPNPCGGDFFGLVPWYAYLGFTKDPGGGCSSNIDFINGGWTKLWLIALAIFQDLLRIAGVVAIGFVIYGGIQYVVSQGQSERTSKAYQTILNALKGLVAVVIAAPSVNFVADKLGGSINGTTGLPNVAANSSTLSSLLSVVFGVIGAISLLMVTIGGYRYIISQAEPQATAQAKDTILYALIGVAVSALAITIVQFVFNRI